MRVLLFGSDRPTSRTIVELLLKHGGVTELVTMKALGLTAYAKAEAESLGIPVRHFWMDPAHNRGAATRAALMQMLAVAPPDLVMFVRPLARHMPTAELCKELGLQVVFGQLNTSREVTWMTEWEPGEFAPASR